MDEKQILKAEEEVVSHKLFFRQGLSSVLCCVPFLSAYRSHRKSKDGFATKAAQRRPTFWHCKTTLLNAS
jgi:hypothetical protein